MTRHRGTVVLVGLLVLGCEQGGGLDASVSRTDAPTNDAPAIDAELDAPDPRPDAPDAPPDGTDAPSTPMGIAGVRWGSPGTSRVIVEDAVVTRVAPEVGSLPAGFFVQETPLGPGLFVSVGSGDIRPAPRVGDRARFVVTHLADLEGVRVADEIAGYTVLASPVDLATFVQRVEPLDLATRPHSLESELVVVSSTLGAFFAADASWLEAELLDPDGSSLAGLRIPSSLRTVLALTPGCRVEATAIAWREGARASAMVHGASDLQVSDCPGPRVVSASALDVTTVEVVFDRALDDSSLRADGSQFTFTGGLRAVGARRVPSGVIVSTEPQASGATYTVVVDETLLGPTGSSVDTMANTASFVAPLGPARVRINELGPSRGALCDVIELRVIEAGDLQGIELQENGEPRIYFGGSVRVGINDLVLVHFASSSECGDAPDETASVDEHPRATYPTNVDTAFDFYVDHRDLPTDAFTLVVLGADGRVQDAFVGHHGVPSSFAGFVRLDAMSVAAELLASAEWTDTPAPVSMTPAVYFDIALRSILFRQARQDDRDTNSRFDWACRADGACPTGSLPSLGRLNAGQSHPE